MDFINLHRAAKDISGNRYGRLVALGPVFVKKFASGANHVHWLCLCDCGNEKVISIAKLSTGNTRSCSCLQRETQAASGGISTHGMHRAPEYEVWHSMHQRCRNPNAKNYKSYGGRGIVVCERWSTFEAFFADMGTRPSSDHSIDRYPDNDGNYEPSNCRWATPSEQQRNMRTNRIVSAFGRTEPLVAFCRDEAHYNLALNRINRGWDTERALSQAAARNGPVPKVRTKSGFWN